MTPDSPADALGPHVATVREIIVDVVRTRHSYAAAAHQVAHTRNMRGYSTLWDDLLRDVQEAFEAQGCDSHRLAPAGYNVPIVNNCIIYVWRVPATGDPGDFAASPTRKACFNNALPPEMPLFGPEFLWSSMPTTLQPGSDLDQSDELEAVKGVLDGEMPVVLVRVYSSPRQLREIVWAVAELDRETGKVNYYGEEAIWQAEQAVSPDASDVEPFSAGTPVEPVVEPREQQSVHPDA